MGQRGPAHFRALGPGIRPATAHMASVHAVCHRLPRVCRSREGGTHGLLDRVSSPCHPRVQLHVEDYALLLSTDSPLREAINRAVLHTIYSAGWKATGQRYIAVDE